MTEQRRLIAVALFLTLAASVFATPTAIQFATYSHLPYTEGSQTLVSIGSPPDFALMRVFRGGLRSAGDNPNPRYEL